MTRHGSDRNDRARRALIGGVFAAFAVLAALYVFADSQDALSVLLAASALLALGLLGVAIRRASTCGDLDASTWLTLSIGILLSLPIVATIVSSSAVRERDATRELVQINPSWYDTAVYITLGLVIAISLALLLRRLALDGRRVKLNIAGLLAILLWAVAHLAATLHGYRLVGLSGLALLFALTAAAVLPRGRGAAIGVGIFGVVLAAASGGFAALDWSGATVDCRHECVLGDALTGVLPNENLLGTTLLATLPFAYLGFRGWPRNLARPLHRGNRVRDRQPRDDADRGGGRRGAFRHPSLARRGSTRTAADGAGRRDARGGVARCGLDRPARLAVGRVADQACRVLEGRERIHQRVAGVRQRPRALGDALQRHGGAPAGGGALDAQPVD